MNNVEFKKLRNTIRSELQGMAKLDKRYYIVLKGFNLADKYHSGKRKDGQPEFSHQLMIVGYLLTIIDSLENAPMVILAALWHDLYEDYHNKCSLLVGLMKAISEEGFIYAVRLSKIRDGKKISYEQYFKEMSECIVCSIVKLVDRASNISTMIGVFDFDKQDGYLQDLIDWFFPMLKKAKRLFPEQKSAYENVKSFLTCQRDTIVAVRAEVAKKFDLDIYALKT
jgi:(p)ppGpp synthase/HD superfamily hydrolase